MYKILFIDTLTTGMNPDKCAIYRIGGIFTVNGREVRRFDLHVRPFDNARISDQCIWISGETRTSVIRYPDQEEAFKTFLSLLDEQVNIHNPKDKIHLGGFNTDRFDYPFIREWFRRNGNEHFRDYFYVQTLDMMSITNFSLLKTRSDMEDFYLETAARELGVRPAGEDRYDCVANSRTCLEMFHVLSKRFVIDDVSQKDELTETFRNY